MNIFKDKNKLVATPDQLKINRSIFAQLIYLGISGIMFYLGAYLLLEKFNYIVSQDAYINSRIIDVNSPQEGTITDFSLELGDPVNRGQKIMLIENKRISDLPARAIQTRINETKEKIFQGTIYLNKLTNLLKQSQIDAKNQQILEIREAQEKLEKEKATFQGAKSAHNLAKINYQRSKSLWESGVYSLSQFELSEVELEEKKSEIESIKRDIYQLEANLVAARKGLNLNRTRSNFDPRLRVQEIEIQISDQIQTIANLEKLLMELEAEMLAIQKESIKMKTTIIRSPKSGTIWKVIAQNGQFVSLNSPLLQIVDCEARWVDAIVNERDLSFVKIGSQASVELYGINNKITAEVTQIRSGVQRVSTGDDLAIPLPENLKPIAQVRLELNRSIDSLAVNNNTFCLVGYTGVVRFKKR